MDGSQPNGEERKRENIWKKERKNDKYKDREKGVKKTNFKRIRIRRKKRDSEKKETEK